MDGYRRRHNQKHNRFRHLVPVISVISGCILILYCFLYLLLAPSHDHPHHFPHLKSSLDDNNNEDVKVPES
nr:O-fucosyltransferase 6-like [Tanacetum cinerariifolium]